MRLFSTISLFTALMVGLMGVASAAPIQEIEGIITDVGEGILWLKPEGVPSPRKFLLRWKASFVPPKLPQKGDRVIILFKDKEEGAVIYGVKYLSLDAPAPSSPPDSR